MSCTTLRMNNIYASFALFKTLVHRWVWPTFTDSFRRDPIFLPVVPVPLGDCIVCDADLLSKSYRCFEVPDWVLIKLRYQSLFVMQFLGYSLLLLPLFGVLMVEHDHTLIVDEDPFLTKLLWVLFSFIVLVLLKHFNCAVCAVTLCTSRNYSLGYRCGKVIWYLDLVRLLQSMFQHCLGEGCSVLVLKLFIAQPTASSS